jgi:benzodiazapine receptor
VNTKLKRFFSLIGLILLCQGVGILGALSTTQNLEGWYRHLTKPFFNPPNWIFGPVWTSLYLMMAVSCWLVLCQPSDKKLKTKALLFFGLQLIANALWSFLFFGMQNTFYGLVDILLLAVLIFLTLKSFRVISKLAAMLLWPYFAWVCFATLLNFSLWWLNR